MPLVNAINFSHLLTYTDGDGAGSVQFTSDFTASSAIVGVAQIMFYNLKHNGENNGSYYSTVFVAGYHGAIRRYINTTGEIIYEFQGVGLLTFLTPWKYQK